MRVVTWVLARLVKPSGEGCFVNRPVPKDLPEPFRIVAIWDLLSTWTILMFMLIVPIIINLFALPSILNIFIEFDVQTIQLYRKDNIKWFHWRHRRSWLTIWSKLNCVTVFPPLIPRAWKILNVAGSEYAVPAICILNN